ncbi:MAG: flavin reductase, partial [Proteobacteria bacterium]|nr:flavin reductase [Pseudomonadota bacterium]
QELRLGMTVHVYGRELLVLDCELKQELIVATHAVFVGMVVGLQSRDGAPLLYSDQAYRTLETPGKIASEDIQL